MTKLRIFLADDHPVVREGLKALINSHPDLEVVGEASDGFAAVEQAPLLAPDVIVLDITMPVMGGAEAASKLKQRCPQARIVALTVHEDRHYLRQLLEAGASGYLLKRAAASELVQAIRTAASGGLYLDPSLADRFMGSAASQRGGVVDKSAQLSDREEQVIRLIAQGYSNKEIAARLSLSVKTIETHKARGLKKLGLRGRAELVRHAVHCGWLDSSEMLASTSTAAI